MRRAALAWRGGRRALVASAAMALVTSCDRPERQLSTADISAQAKAQVRAELGLSEDAALFSNVFVPGYEDGELMACGSVSGTRADGQAIEPRRFIVQVEPARWVRWETGDPRPSRAAGFERTWQEICREPDDRSEVPLIPE